MLNRVKKKKALEENEKLRAECAKLTKNAQNMLTDFSEAVKSLDSASDEFEKYVENLKNCPLELNKKIWGFKSFIERSTENGTSWDNLGFKNSKVSDSSNAGIIGAVGGGIATGAGVAAFGSAAAFELACNVGVASTGTAISTLMGVAETNAALAWLGGGSMAVGSRVLALFGPIGLTISGLSLIGGAAYQNSKNKKIAKQANENSEALKKHMSEMSIILRNTRIFMDAINKCSEDIRKNTKMMKDTYPNDYTSFSNEQKTVLNSTIDNAIEVCQQQGKNDNQGK